jgi:hypothetical protein
MEDKMVWTYSTHGEMRTIPTGIVCIGIWGARYGWEIFGELDMDGRFLES